MNTPLCQFCLKSGILCPKCQENLRLGKIDDLDIKIARLLLKLEKKYSSLGDITFHKAYSANDLIAIVVDRGNLPILLGYGGKIIRELSEKTGKKIRILEKEGGRRKFLEDLFAPINIVTINTIWLPDGSTETRVILAGHPRRLPADVETLKTLAWKIRKMTLRIGFEREAI